MPHKSKKRAIAKALREAKNDFLAAGNNPVARRLAEAALIAAGGDPAQVLAAHLNAKSRSEAMSAADQNGIVHNDVGNKDAGELDNNAGPAVRGAEPPAIERGDPAQVRIAQQSTPKYSSEIKTAIIHNGTFHKGVGNKDVGGLDNGARSAFGGAEPAAVATAPVLNFASAVKSAPSKSMMAPGAPSVRNTKAPQLTNYVGFPSARYTAPSAAANNPPAIKQLGVRTASNVKTTPINNTIKTTADQEAVAAHTLLELRGNKPVDKVNKTEPFKKALETVRKGVQKDMMLFGEGAVPQQGSGSGMAPGAGRNEPSSVTARTKGTTVAPATTVEKTVDKTIDNTIGDDSKDTIEPTDGETEETEETDAKPGPKTLTDADLLHLLRRLITSVPPAPCSESSPKGAPTAVLPHLTQLTTNLSCFLNILPRDEATQPLRTELRKYLLRTSILYHQISHTAGTPIDLILASLGAQKGFMKTLLDEVMSFRTDATVVDEMETTFQLDPASQAGHCPFGCRDLQLSERVVVEIERVVLRPAEMIDAPEDVVVSLEEAIAELEQQGVCMKKPDRLVGVTGAEGILGTFGHTPLPKKVEAEEDGEEEELPADYEAKAWKQARKLRQKVLKKEMRRLEREAKETGVTAPAAPAAVAPAATTSAAVTPAATASAAVAHRPTIADAGKPMTYAQLAARAANAAAAMASKAPGAVPNPTPAAAPAVNNRAAHGKGTAAVGRGLPASTPTGPAGTTKFAAAAPAGAAFGNPKSSAPSAFTKPGAAATSKPAAGPSGTVVGKIGTLSQAMNSAKEESDKKLEEKLTPEEIRKRARRAKMKAREREGKNQRREAMARLLSDDGRSGGPEEDGPWGGAGML